ncbi:condensation domain-containing protein [Streptomyces carminius]|nr:condensation domain-containing protein [Streptomyces carminius]
MTHHAATHHAATHRTAYTRPGRAEERLPLAPGQETLWELMRGLAPHDPGAALMPVVDFRRLDGEVDPAVLEQALRDVTLRHHVLRTVFETTGDEPLLSVRPDTEPSFALVDLSGLPARERDRRLAGLVHGEQFAAFDLRSGPLWRVRLVRTAPREHLLTVGFFHVVSDGWACRVFVEDLLRAYRVRLGRATPQEPLDVSFRDVASWQRAALPEDGTRDDYWRRHLLPLPPEPVFPALGTPRGPDLTAEVAHRFTFDDGSVRAMRTVAWRARSTAFLSLMAAYHVLMCRLTGQSRLIGGTTTLGRATPASRQVIGQFTNNVYLELRADPGDCFLDVIRAVHTTMAEAVAHNSSFNRVARAVRPDFDAHRPWPFVWLFHYWFQSAAPAAPVLEYPELSVRQVSPRGEEALGDGPPLLALGDVAEELLPVWAQRGVPGIILDDDRRGGVMVYNRDLYDGALVADVVAEYRSVVSALLAAPDRPVREVLPARRPVLPAPAGE